MKVRCPTCKVVSVCQNEWAGREVACNKCGERFRIPASALEHRQAPPAVTSSSPPPPVHPHPAPETTTHVVREVVIQKSDRSVPSTAFGSGFFGCFGVMSAILLVCLLVVGGCVALVAISGISTFQRSVESGGDEQVQVKHESDQPLIDYKVVSRESFPADNNESFNVEVQLVDGRLPSKRELFAISKHLRQLNMEYEYLFIYFFLPGMDVDSGAYATSHHTPDPEPVKFVNGNLPLRYKKLTSSN